MGSTKMKRMLKLALNFFLIYCLTSFTLTLADEKVEENSTRSSVKLSEILRNISQSASSPPPEVSTIAPKLPIKRNARLRRVRVLNRRANRNSSAPIEPDRDKDAVIATATAVVTEDNKSQRESSKREPKALQPVTKISGIVDGGKKNPQDLIRNALLNHTLEHGGEQDLDKLVFSNLPNGSRLVLRTVRIIRTDEDGNPMDDKEKAQPTYWDVTLANATDLHDDEEGEESDTAESDESEEEEEEVNNEKKGKVVEAGKEMPFSVALKSNTDQVAEGDKKVPTSVRSGLRKKSDLESSGSHSTANYRHLNDYGSAGREKEHGVTNYHGNTHGNTHKHTYTVTDGKDVKPYHGTEKGATDYANDHGKSNNDQGERYKSSKRKNKGRKVTGFKRVYHKEEYQRTEHFYDDEEAKKIAESFGLSEAKDASNHGTKDDKRKYQGVRTDYLDGKKHENERGTHNGYSKGQHNTYRDNQKHAHHSDYGKSQSQSHGSSPHHNNHHGYDYQQNDHSHHNDHHPQQQHAEYHPNHNYHASYSNPKKSTISQVPNALLDQLGGARSLASIIPAPMAHSFTVTEFAPLVSESIATSDPNKMSVTVHSLPETSFDTGNFTNNVNDLNNDNQLAYHDEDDGNVYNDRRKPRRKRPRQRKMYFSPKHRQVKDDDENVENTNGQSIHSLASPPKQHPVSYHVSSVSDIINSPDNPKDSNGQIAGENDTKYTPYAPNFAPPPPPPPSTDSTYIIAPQQEYNRGNAGRPPKAPWLWPPRRQKRPRPAAGAYPPLHMQQLLSPQAAGYPARGRSQMHLANIPLRHASAFHRLGNRHHRYSTLKHHPKLGNPYEISTRKSDSVENDNDNRTSLYSQFDNDSAHYFNHNQRYAKHHLTSTINPLRNGDNNNNKNSGVRNTLIDPVPGVYSTVIKVLPATMLNLNDSSIQQNGLDQHHLGSITTGHSSTVTQRPLTQADTISITTAYPQHFHNHHHQALSSQQQELRPFIPKKRWLTFTLNLGNPDFKLGNEFGPSQHPFRHNSQKASYLMQGIKNGILKPLGRGAHALLASPSGHSQHNYQRQRSPLHHSHGQHIMMRRPLMHKRPFSQYPHPIFAHNVVSYENFGDQQKTPGVREMLPSMSKENVQAVRLLSSTSPTSVSLPVLKSKKPQFFYNYKANEIENKTVTEVSEQEEQDAERRGDSKGSVVHKPMLKVAQTISTLPTVSSTTTPLAVKEHNVRKIGMEPQPTQPPPFINGIMDSVADFFGRMG